MANEEVLGPRKTMFVLVIVVGCFAVLWPRILSPLILGHTQEQLKPNKLDRETGCCEMLFESEIAVLEIINEVCSSAVQSDGKLSPYAAAECRKSVNETCGVDIAAFLKRSENVGKTTKMLLDTMKTSNSSCLREHFGVPVWKVATHQAINSWKLEDTLKQERPPMRVGPHPALRERGRAIPAGVPAAPPRAPVPLPPHVRVRSSPLSVYFELDVKPPPIPGMRPPLGSPGGPVPAPKSSMGFVMPIYTICIIVFFVYTLSKILFKRTGSVPYDTITPDPQFRRRVFRDDSRSSPDKLGPKERDTIVTAISGLVAEVQQQMEASYAQNQQRQDLQENHTRPYTNGTVLHSGPVQIVASEYREASKEKTPEQKEPSPTPEQKEPAPEPEEPAPEPKEPAPEPKEPSPEPKEAKPEPKEVSPEPKEASPEPEKIPEPKEPSLASDEELVEEEEIPESKESSPQPDEKEPSPEIEINHKNESLNLLKEEKHENVEKEKDSLAKQAEDFLNETREGLRKEAAKDEVKEKQSTPELLEEALKEDSSEKEEEQEEEEESGEEEEPELENASVKVVGMETQAHRALTGTWRRTAPPPAPPTPRRPPHEAEEVKSIILETEIPAQSRVLVTDFAEKTADKPAPKHSPMVVSGKMTLSLIQDAPRDTPERDPESTMDDFTTASGVTQPAAEKEEDLSEEEIEEEIEVEEIEEEIEVEEEEEEEEEEVPKETKTEAKTGGK